MYEHGCIQPDLASSLICQPIPFPLGITHYSSSPRTLIFSRCCKQTAFHLQEQGKASEPQNHSKNQAELAQGRNVTVRTFTIKCYKYYNIYRI